MFNYQRQSSAPSFDVNQSFDQFMAPPKPGGKFGVAPGLLNNPKPRGNTSNPRGIGTQGVIQARNNAKYQDWWNNDRGNKPRPVMDFSSPTGTGYSGAINARNRNEQLTFKERDRYNKELQGMHDRKAKAKADRKAKKIRLWNQRHPNDRRDENGKPIPRDGNGQQGWSMAGLNHGGGGGESRDIDPIYDQRFTDSMISRGRAQAYEQGGEMRENMKQFQRPGMSLGAGAANRATAMSARALADVAGMGPQVQAQHDLANRANHLKQMQIQSQSAFNNAQINQQYAGIQNANQLAAAQEQARQLQFMQRAMG